MNSGNTNVFKKPTTKNIKILTLHSEADLVGHVSDLTDGIGQVVVLLQKVKCAESQQLEGQTHVTVIVEPVIHLYT